MKKLFGYYWGGCFLTGFALVELFLFVGGILVYNFGPYGEEGTVAPFMLGLWLMLFALHSFVAFMRFIADFFK